MSRGRFNPSLLVNAMVMGIVEAPKDPVTGTAMRPAQLMPVMGRSGKPGCRMTFCREKERCHCTCKTCKRECLFRDVKATEVDGIVTLAHSDGQVVVTLPLEEYELLRSRNERLPPLS